MRGGSGALATSENTKDRHRGRRPDVVRGGGPAVVGVAERVADFRDGFVRDDPAQGRVRGAQPVRADSADLGVAANAVGRLPLDWRTR